SQRPEPLGRDDWNAFWLTGEAEELLVAGRVVFADRSEMLIFVAQEHYLPEVLPGMSFDFGHAIEDGALEVELHHHANRFRQARIHPHWKIERAHFALLDQPGKRRQWGSVLSRVILFAFVALARRAKHPFHLGIVVK